MQAKVMQMAKKLRYTMIRTVCDPEEQGSLVDIRRFCEKSMRLVYIRPSIKAMWILL